MSVFSKAIGWASSAADSFFGTGGTISKVTGFLGADTSATLSDVGSAIMSSGADYVAGRFGGDEKYTPYEPPSLGTGASAASRVATTAGSFKSSAAQQFKGTGMNNPAVQRAWQKASRNPRIQASLEVVRPTIGKRGPTKSLREAQVKV